MFPKKWHSTRGAGEWRNDRSGFGMTPNGVGAWRKDRRNFGIAPALWVSGRDADRVGLDCRSGRVAEWQTRQP